MVKLMQVREVSHEAGKVVTVARAESLDKPMEWAVGFFFGNTELSVELWTIIAAISGFDGRVGTVVLLKA